MFKSTSSPVNATGTPTVSHLLDYTSYNNKFETTGNKIYSATDQFDFPRFKNRRRYAKLAVEKRRGIPLPSPSRKDNLRFVHTQRNSYATVADIWRWSRSISVSEIVKRTGFSPRAIRYSNNPSSSPIN